MDRHRDKADNSSNAKTFQELLDWRQHCRDTQLSECVPNLKEVVLGLVDHYQDLDELSEELNQVQTNGEGNMANCRDLGNELNVELFLSSLQAQAGVLDTPLEVLAAVKFARNLQSIADIRNQNQHTHLLHDIQQYKVKMIVNGIQKLREMHSFNTAHFIKKINSKSLLHVELIWILHKESIMPINRFITCNLGKQEVFAALTQGIVQIGLQGSTEEKSASRSKEIVQGFFAFLVTHGYPESSEVSEDPGKVAVQKASVILLDTIMNEYLKGFLAETNHLNVLELIRLDGMVIHQSSINFFKHLLTQHLTSTTDIIVSQAILDQHLWTFAKTSSHVTTFYREILLCFKEEEIANMIQKLLEHEEVNWQAFLAFISTFLVMCPGAPKLVKGLINKFLSVAVEEMDQDFLIIALLLARQAAAEGPQIFSLYPRWFKETFSEGSLYITSKKSFIFLMKILTSLVPFEPAHILKAHIQKPPHVIGKCQELLCDYILLAKTRLADLKEPLESSGTFPPNESSDGAKAKEFVEKTEADVEQAIAVFESTNQLPHSIIEASIFKYPYFMGRFLPVLLTPRMLPDIPDSKMKLIEMLRSLGKIPVKMMEKYKEACEREINKLLEGIDMDEDDCEMLEPIDALKKTMDNFVAAVKEFDSRIESLNSQLANLSEKIQLVLFNEPGSHDLSNRDELFILDLKSPSMTSSQIEVTEIILDGFCRACIENGIVTVHWADNFVAMLSQFEIVLKSVMLRICTLILHQGPQLELQHLHGLSILLVHLHWKQEFVSLVTITGHGLHQETTCGQFLPTLFNLLKNETGDKMKFELHLSAEIIKYAINLHDFAQHPEQVIPEVVIEKFLYLVPRLYSDARYLTASDSGASTEELIKVYLSPKFNEKCEKHAIKLSLNQWIRSEIAIQPHLDCLSFLERMEYHRWIVNEKFYNAGVESETCATLFMELVDYSKTIGLQLGVYVHKGCLHHDKQQNTRSKNGSQAEILKLLQEIIHSSNFKVSADGRSNPESCSWMMEMIQRRLLINENNTNLEVACILNIITSLPAYLLVSNVSNFSPTIQSLMPLVNLVNAHLKQHLMETVCSLPFHVTSYFAQLLCHLNSSCVQHLKSTCPLLIASFLIHLKKLSPSLSRLQSKSTLQLCKELTSLQNHAKEVISSSARPLQFPHTDDADIWLLSVALYNLPRHQLHPKLHRLVSFEKILKNLMELLVADVAHSIFRGMDFSVNLQLAQSIIEMYPECLKVTVNSIFTCFVASQTMIEFMPLSLFRVYLTVPMTNWVKYLNKHGILQTILVHHQLLIGLYTRVDQEYPKESPIITVEFMTSCFKFIADLILKSNRPTLQNVDKAVLKKSSPEIQNQIKKMFLR